MKTNYIKVDKEKILDWLKANLNEERYSHSLGTAMCASELAKFYGVDSEKAYIAGLLHDTAKCFETKKLLELIKENNIKIFEEEKINYKTLHAPVGAYLAKNLFGVTDSEILDSIRWHTIGKIDMTNFEKIIFIADKIEPNTRDKDFSEKISKWIYETDGLDRAMLECYKLTIKSLVDRNLKICVQTIDIYNYLLNKFVDNS